VFPSSAGGWLIASAPVVTDSRAGESGFCVTQQLTAKRLTLADRKLCLLYRLRAFRSAD